MLKNSLFEEQQTISKSDLIDPVLLILAKGELMGFNYLETSQLRRALSDIVVPSAKDNEVTPGDDVPRYQRALRNLISHNTLITMGLIKVKEQGKRKNQSAPSRNAKIALTTKGRDRVLTSWLNALPLDETPVSPDPFAEKQASEANLKTAALLMIAKLEKDTKKPVTTTQMRDAVRRFLSRIHPDDVTPKNKNQPWETPFDRAIRNLISHNTLKSGGWVKEIDGGLKTTPAGRREALK